ncbi:MAG: hypothetical protein JSS11_17670 [Verrucomicrobia bacterium]|nr:hypothetical protein [Verrucomicrobiota bacterium]
MNLRSLSCAALLSLAAIVPLRAQPSFAGPMPSRAVVEGADQRRREYLDRIHEVLAWRAAQPVVPTATDPAPVDMAAICSRLALRQDAARNSRDVIKYMQDPGSGPFWMFPVVCAAYLGRDQLTPEAQKSIRDAWRSQMQVRGDTENHWVMYYSSLYLMSDLYPGEPGTAWYNGKSSTENLNESQEWLLQWMDLSTTVGQGEFNPTHYIGEYMIPLTMLATWSKDPAMRQRAHIMIDWILADFASNTLHGYLRGANSRSDDNSVLERWNALSSFFSWICFGQTPPTAGYGGWGIYYAAIAENYTVPEVIYRIAMDRGGDFEQHNLKRTRRRWRYSDVLFAPVYKTDYIRDTYAVGSNQGGALDSIQAHIWDVTWDVPDPRGVHNTMFSLHPYSSGAALQMYFVAYPEPWIKGVTFEGKPSYDSADKILGPSPYEQVYQNLDTVIALYDIPPDTRFPHINGFFSKDLKNVTEDKSGWIFAQGGQTFLAYRPLAGYEWQEYVGYATLWVPERGKGKGDRILQSPHLKNGTIVQAAAASEFKDFAAFQAAIRALPLEFKLEPVPTVTMTTLRGQQVTVTYGQAPVVNGATLDYAKTWKLFEGPYLNAEKGSRRLVITHGKLERILDLNTLTISDQIRE